MIKTVLLTSVIAISGAVLPASAAERLHVSVPFSFMVNGSKMAPGEYDITQSENGMVILAGAKTSAMFLTVPAEYSKGNTTALNFTSGDSNPVLTAIQVTGSVTREIPQHNPTERKTALVSAR